MRGPEVTVQIEDDARGVATQAARLFAEQAEKASAARRPIRVALSGGSTPRLMYEILASDEYRRLSWHWIEFFFGDERWVPRDHQDSNYKLAYDYLLRPLGDVIGPVFPVPTSIAEPEEAARQYEATIRRTFDTQEDKVPRFDLIFLGMGEDGHTASLFPHTAALQERSKLVTANHVDKLNTWRITLTAPVLNAAKQVLVMVAGEGKAPTLKQVLEGEYNPQEYPSQLLRQAEGKVMWLVDRAAAKLLESGAD